MHDSIVTHTHNKPYYKTNKTFHILYARFFLTLSFSYTIHFLSLPKLYPILYSVLFKREEPLEEQVMEELPRNLLLNIPLKVPDKLEWTSSLLAYITSSYAEDAEKYKQDATTLDAMRDQALFQPTTSSFALEDLSM